jgi:uncharacterized membrane protein
MFQESAKVLALFALVALIVWVMPGYTAVAPH